MGSNLYPISPHPPARPWSQPVIVVSSLLILGAVIALTWTVARMTPAATVPDQVPAVPVASQTARPAASLTGTMVAPEEAAATIVVPVLPPTAALPQATAPPASPTAMRPISTMVGATMIAVHIADFAFAPEQLIIQVGDTVRWTNDDKAPHTATSGEGRFDSGDLTQGASYQFTFTQPGSYAYVCALHEGMAGTITVVAAEATAAVVPAALPTAPAAATSAAAAEPAPVVATRLPVVPPAVASPGGAAPVTEAVSIQGFAFTPAQITLRVGDTVRWTNQDAAAHTATANSGQFNSGNLARGTSYQFTFTQAGTYSYFCARHAEMTGTIRVIGDGTAPLPASAPAPSPGAPTDDHGGHGGDDPAGDDHGGGNDH